MLGSAGSAEEVRLRPGCEHDESPESVLPSSSVTVLASGSAPTTSAVLTSTLPASRRSSEVEPDVGAQLRRCHLVEQRLELVVAVLVDDGDPDAVLAGEALRAGDACEASTDDDDMNGAALVHRPARNDRPSCVGRHHPEGMNKAALLRYEKTLTARAMTRPSTASEMKDWTVIAIFAHGTSGITSVGLKAVALVYPR